MIVRHEIPMNGRTLTYSYDYPNKNTVGSSTSFSGTLTRYWEITGYASGTQTVDLLNSSGSTISTCSVSTIGVYRSLITTDDYIRLEIGTIPNGMVIGRASIIIIQDTGESDLLATEVQYPMVSTALAVYGSTITSLGTIWGYDSADWDPTPIFSAKVGWLQINDKNSITIWVQEDDGSFGTWTNKVAVVNAGISEVYQETSADFVPISGRHYRLAYSSDATKATYGANIWTGHIVAKQGYTASWAQSTPHVLNGGQTSSICFSNDGKYYVWGEYNNIGIYRYIDSSTSTLCTIINGPIHQPNYIYDASWDSTNTYVVLMCSNSPGIQFLTRTGEFEYTMYSFPVDYYCHSAREVAWAPDDSYFLTCAGYITIDGNTSWNGIGIYTVANGVPTLQPDNIGTVYCYGISISADGTNVAACSQYTYATKHYAVTAGPTLTEYSTGLPNLPASGNAVAFSHDDVYLAIAYSSAPFCRIYKRTGNTFTYAASMTGGTDPLTHLEWSPDDSLLAFGSWTSGGSGLMSRVSNFAVVATQSQLQTRFMSFFEGGASLIQATDSSPYSTVFDITTSRVLKFLEYYNLSPYKDDGLGDTYRINEYDASEWSGVTIEMYPEHDGSTSSTTTRIEEYGTTTVVADSTITGANLVRGTTPITLPSATLFETTVTTL